MGVGRSGRGPITDSVYDATGGAVTACPPVRNRVVPNYFARPLNSDLALVRRQGIPVAFCGPSGKPFHACLEIHGEVNGSVFALGDFINALVSFLLVAIVVYFFVILPINVLTTEGPPAKGESCGGERRRRR
jgi:hypothetical protein